MGRGYRAERDYATRLARLEQQFIVRRDTVESDLQRDGANHGKIPAVAAASLARARCSDILRHRLRISIPQFGLLHTRSSPPVRATQTKSVPGLES